MPKVEYHWVFWVVAISYFFGYDIVLNGIVAIILITLWNGASGLSKDFGYVSKQEFKKIQAERDALSAKLDKLKDAGSVFEQAKEHIRREAKLEGQDAVFNLFIRDKVEFTEHLRRYTYNNKSYDYSSSTGASWRTVLEVSDNPSKTEVDAAYKTLIKRYHPDVNKDPAASAKMQEINEAKDQADKYFAKL